MILETRLWAQQVATEGKTLQQHVWHLNTQQIFHILLFNKDSKDTP